MEKLGLSPKVHDGMHQNNSDNLQHMSHKMWSLCTYMHMHMHMHNYDLLGVIIFSFINMVKIKWAASDDLFY